MRLPCPSARSVDNWKAEFSRWLGGTEYELRVAKVHKAAANLSVKVQLQELVGVALPRHQIVIMSYESLYVHGRGLCCGSGVDLLVADEAHVLANDGVRAKVVRRVPAAARLLITGTPLSNRLMELVGFRHVSNV